MIRSIFINSPSPVSTQIYPYCYGWSLGSDGNWGTIVSADWGNIGYTRLYRQNGVDTKTVVEVKPFGGGTPIEVVVSSAPDEDTAPVYSKITVTGCLIYVRALKTLASAQESDNVSEIQKEAGAMSYMASAKFYTGCRCYMDGEYLGYTIEEDLPDVCNPGTRLFIYTQQNIGTADFVRKDTDGYTKLDLTLATAVVSGSNRITFSPEWVISSSGTGFYWDTIFMKEGGFIQLGPNENGEINTSPITKIVSSNVVELEQIQFNFSYADPVSYWYSNVNSDWSMHIPDGIDPDSSETSMDARKTTETSIQTCGGLSTFTNVEEFILIPWAIPAPYSIRNVPHTNVWLRLDDPSIPFNMSTLLFKVNGVNVTDLIEVTSFPGGVELFYDPISNFDMASRITLDVHISCSPSIYRTIGDTILPDTEYVEVDGGDISIFQPGGTLKLGPNGAGEWEISEIQFVFDEGIVKLTEPVQYEYSIGDDLLYTYDDYPVDVNYYFDIVDDFRPPTFDNIYPEDGMTKVSRTQWVRIDIKDEGLGVDISTFTLTLDNMVVIPQIYKFSDHWYRAVYTPPVPYYYNATVHCFATVLDLSSRRNRAFVTWTFETEEGELPFIINPDPNYCAFPVHLKSHIGLDLFSRDAGVSVPSLVFTWDQTRYEVIKYPKIYRES